jgi:hypothetical protein
MIKSQLVEEFMAQAAFAVEVKNREQLHVPVIWNNSQSRNARISIGNKHGADVVITCCPLPPSRDDDMMPIEKTFEFQPLSKKLKGDNILSLGYSPKDSASGRPDKLILTVTKTNDIGQPVDVTTVEWPVYYDPGGCAVFVDIDGHDRLPSAAEGNGSQETATRLRSRGRKSYYKLWEEYRCDPGKSYWEGIEYESLPMESLGQFVEGDAADQDDNAMAIEISDDDSGPAMNSPPLESIGHGSRAGGGRQRQPDRTRDDDTLQQNKKRKRHDAAASERRAGKRREEPASAFARTSTFRETRSETAMDSDAEGEFTDYSMEPMNGASRNARPSQRPRLVADSSPSEQTSPGHRDTAGQNMSTQNVTSQNRGSLLRSRPQRSAGNEEQDFSASRLTAANRSVAPRRGQVNTGRLSERAATGDAPSLVAMRPDLGRQVPTLARHPQPRAPYAQMH